MGDHSVSSGSSSQFDREDVDVPTGPVTAPGGWSSLLTWRKPKSKAQPAKLDSIVRTPPSNRVQLPRYSPSGDQNRASSRSRAPIPFDLGPRRTASSSSTNSLGSQEESTKASSSIGTDYDNQGKDEEIYALSSAFASLAKVREKDDGAHATIRSTRISSPSSTRRPSMNIATPPLTPNNLPPGGWLAWGTSRIKSTLPRGMASNLLFSDQGKEADLGDIPSQTNLSSPSTSSSIPSTLQSEKWKPTERDEIDQVVDRIVGFAGIDGESRSIVTLSAPNLPPWDQVSHDAILQRILTRTLPLVESPGGYTLILFASGADLIDGSQGSKTIWPGWTWCWKAWRSLGRSYRKNLKRLYIVHPSRFTRTLVRLISTGSYFISPKFAKKIVQCDSLEALNEQIPLSQLDIPPEVLIWDIKMGAKEDINLLGQEGTNAIVPAMVRDCVEALKSNRNRGTCLLETEGIFRVSPSNALLRSAKYAYQLNRRPNFTLFVEKDVHLPAALLKDYLRSLPLPLFPASVYPIIENCPTGSEEELLQYIRQVLLPTLAEEKLILLSYVLQCLHETSMRSEKNRMDASNLAVVITPNLVRSEDVMKDVMMCRVQKLNTGSHTNQEDSDSKSHQSTALGTVIAFCIDRYFEVFDEFDYELPVLNFHMQNDQQQQQQQQQQQHQHHQPQGDFGTLTRSKKAVIGNRQVPSSPPRNSLLLQGTFTPPSPSANTPTTLRSTNSLRVKNRLLSGGSFRSGGLNTSEKGNQSVALVGTSAKGEFERGGGSKIQTTPKRQSPTTTRRDSIRSDEDGNVFGVPSSPVLQVKRVGMNLDVASPRHDRRPLSGVFEE